MPRAITMSYDDDLVNDTGNPDEPEIVDDTSGFMDDLLGGGAQLLSSILGGGNGKSGQSIGEGIGALAGGALGTLAGGAGTGIGAALGKAAGGAVEKLVRSQTVRPPKKSPAKRMRQPTKRDRKLLADAERMSKRTGEPRYLQEAQLRVFRPAEYKRRRDAGTLWSQNALAPRTEPAVPRLRLPMKSVAIDNATHFNAPEIPYDDMAQPDTRPRPMRHISTVPMSDEQRKALLRDVPALRALDPRLIRLLSGEVSVARDVAGVNPTTGTYHALPGETPHGITKKLTGQVERTQELLAANPGKAETAGEWNIPPGWLQYTRETGAVTIHTARKYIVVINDTPIGIAKKMGAFDNRPQWWSELKAANPHKPTQSGTGNWVSLYPNEEIGIPDAWPQNSYTIPINPQPTQPETPGLPGPGKTTTVDPGVVPHAQALLAKWALHHPNDCTPSDFGRNPADLLTGVTPRMTQALSSFQVWWNKNHPTQTISTNGELDTPTYHALIEADNATTTPVPWFETAPKPEEPPQKQTSGESTPSTTSTTANNGAPAGWPKEWPWPPFPGTSTTTSPYPSEGASTPPSTNTQPAPSTNTQTTQSNGAPAGWPKEWPWPPLPGYTAPSTTTQPPSGSTSPAPSTDTQTTQSSGAPAGWPKEWPWPPVPGYTVPLPTQQPSGSTSTSPGTTTPSAETTQSNGAPAGWPEGWPWPPPIPGYPAPSTTSQPSTNTLPADSPQPNGAPVGWPKEWPWPPIPGTTTPTPSTTSQPPSTSTSPAPSTGTQSTQSNAPPPGWPKEWPWPPLPGYTAPNPATTQPPSGSTSTAPGTNTAPPQTTTSAPSLDGHLSERERQQLLLLLSNGIDADQLDQLALAYAADGFPLAAAALHARADAIRAQGQSESPPVIFVVDTPQSTPTTESSGSALPVLALIGAGLALS